MTRGEREERGVGDCGRARSLLDARNAAGEPATHRCTAVPGPGTPGWWPASLASLGVGETATKKKKATR
jgi:hypothetical protein